MAKGVELGVAYVSITASAKEFMDEVGKMTREFKIISEEAKKTGDEAGNSLADGLGKAGVFIGKALVAGIAAAGAAATAAAAKLVRGVTEEFAQFQQNKGGIETMFKDSADAMMKYAAQAYKAVGISQNEYMSQATSFSASLIGSLKGDTAAAADAANRIMIAMGDNANKMGTDMASIQNAYQGFAKDQYTMLDNLKLGYGGTKTEAERLVKEAAKMTDVQEKLGITIDANSLDFANFTSAIQVVQEALGINGTTALEAATTISGATGMMKASWADLLVAFGSGENLETALQQVLDSAMTLFQNFTQTFDEETGQWVQDGGMLGRIAEGVKQAAPMLSQAISDILPIILPVAIDLIGQVLDTLVSVLGDGEIIQTLVAGCITLITALVGYIPEFIAAATQIVTGIFEGLWDSVKAIVPEWLEAALVGVGVAIAGIGVIIAKAQIAKMITSLIPVVKTLFAAIAANPIGLIITAIAAVVAGLIYFFTKTEMGIEIWERFTDFLKAAWETLKQAGRDFVESVTQKIDSFKALLERVKQWFTDAKNTVVGVWTAIKDGITNAIQVIVDAVQWVGDKIQAGVDFIVGGITFLLEIWTNIFDTIETVLWAVFGTIIALFTGNTDKIKAIWSGALDVIKGIWENVWNTIRTFFSNIAATIVTAWGKFRDDSIRIFTALVDWLKAMPGRVRDAIVALKDRVVEIATNAWTSFHTKTTELVDALVSWVRGLPGWIRDSIASLASDLRSSATTAWDNFRNSTVTKATEAVDWVRGLPGRVLSALGNLGSTLLQAGKDLIQGFINGITSMASNIVNSIKNTITDKLPQFVKDALGIKSPSRVFQHLGEMTGLGFSLGLADSLSGVVGVAESGLAGLGGLSPSLSAQINPSWGNLDAFNGRLDFNPGRLELERGRFDYDKLAEALVRVSRATLGAQVRAVETARPGLRGNW